MVANENVGFHPAVGLSYEPEGVNLRNIDRDAERHCKVKSIRIKVYKP